MLNSWVTFHSLFWLLDIFVVLLIHFCVWAQPKSEIENSTLRGEEEELVEEDGEYYDEEEDGAEVKKDIPQSEKPAKAEEPKAEEVKKEDPKKEDVKIIQQPDTIKKETTNEDEYGEYYDEEDD